MASKKIMAGSSPTLSSVPLTNSSSKFTVSDVTTPFKEEQFDEIIRSQSQIDRYRANMGLDERQKLLVIVMTKYTILAMAAVITTQLFVIFGVAAILLLIDRESDGNVIGIYYFFWNIDCVVGSLCCYLNFKMNDELYHKLCACCQRRCRLICSEMTKRKIVDAMIDNRANTLHQYLLDDYHE